MATHDYVIANGTGAAVRSDLNNALAAIVSNNSGSSEPGTTYAYQWWADTNANVLKLRNSSNDGWITLRELDGTMLIEDGSASTPGLAFADDVNTGIFSPAADQIGFATGGVERLEIGSSEVVFNDPGNDVDFRVESNSQTHMLFIDSGNNRVGVATNSPAEALHTVGNGVFTGTVDIGRETSGRKTLTLNSSDNGAAVIFRADAGTRARIEVPDGETALAFGVELAGTPTERARIDSSGRLLVGASSDVTGSTHHVVQAVTTGGGRITLARNDTSVTAGDVLGQIGFSGNDANGSYQQVANITCEADGDHGDDDKPGRLRFLVTGDGAGSATERMRITSDGTIQLYAATNGSNQAIQFGDPDADNRGLIQYRHGSDALHIYTAGSERMKLDSSGRLFLGNTAGMNGGLLCVGSGHGSNPPSGDHIKVGPNANRIEFLDTSSNSSDTGSISLWNTVYNNRSADIELYHPSSNTGGIKLQTHDGTSLGERIRIDNNGITYINTTSNPGSARLSIGENFTSRNGLSIKNTGTQGGGQYYALFYNSSDSLAGSISHNGSTTVAFNTSSDYRLKENITSVVDGITRLQQLKPSRFNFIADPNKTVDGFIAHEVQTVIPEAITGDKDAVDDEGNPIYQGIDQSKLVPLLTAALQEAIAKIETLETKVAALEAA